MYIHNKSASGQIPMVVLRIKLKEHTHATCHIARRINWSEKVKHANAHQTSKITGKRKSSRIKLPQEYLIKPHPVGCCIWNY